MLGLRRLRSSLEVEGFLSVRFATFFSRKITGSTQSFYFVALDTEVREGAFSDDNTEFYVMVKRLCVG